MAGGPGSKLAQMRAAGAFEDAELRERIMGAALRTSGELGYRKLTVSALLERYGGYRLQFYRQFASVKACYAAAYEVHCERLVDRLLGAGAQPESWRAGLRAALDELGRFACEQPQLARGLVIEVHIAGEPALYWRRKGLERLSSALDSARRETSSRHSPPPLTAPFMVSAIESSLAKLLASGDMEHFTAAARDLEQIVCAAYFGHPIRQV